MAPKSEYYLPQSYFTSVGGISVREFDKILGSGDPIVKPTSDGYPVFGFIQFLHNKNKRLDNELELAKDQLIEMAKIPKPEPLPPPEPVVVDTTRDDIMADLKRRKEEQLLMQITLKNISLLKLFILKETASARVISAYTEVASAVKTAISDASLKLGGDVRVNQETLTSCFNEAIDILYNNSEHLEWDDEDDAEKIRKKLNELAHNDGVLTSLIERAYAT